MYRVEVKNPCRCFLRHGGVENQTFSDKQTAQEEAENLLDYMKRNYCKKHQFILSQIGNTFTITIQPRS